MKQVITQSACIVLYVRYYLCLGSPDYDEHDYNDNGASSSDKKLRWQHFTRCCYLQLPHNNETTLWNQHLLSAI